ncbi:MAG: hypothetical protein IAE77_26110 [Prosthecobacter sp.]|uniref:hypothetical protein n=1 Tax=Prosthecobacter sp. TaxID=1965333 RepID=UPI0019EC4FD3|nr:hypothetical protein [Prosthecobacter sp.]MBE2286957.1 hypothetical protein [Prosthecobacter sp.]
MDTIDTLAANAFKECAMTVQVVNLCRDVKLLLTHQSQKGDAGVEGKFLGDLQGKGPPPLELKAAADLLKPPPAMVFQSGKNNYEPSGNRNFVIYEAKKPGFKSIYLRIAWHVPLVGDHTSYFVRWQPAWEKKNRHEVVAWEGDFKEDNVWKRAQVPPGPDWYDITSRLDLEARGSKSQSLFGIQRDTCRLHPEKPAPQADPGAHVPALTVVGTFGIAPLKIIIHEESLRPDDPRCQDREVQRTEKPAC